MMSAAERLDEPTPNYVSWILFTRVPDPARFAELARRSMRFCKRHLQIGKSVGHHALVPFWARSLGEAACSLFVDPQPLLRRAKDDQAFRDAVRSALVLGGMDALRDLVTAQGSAT